MMIGMEELLSEVNMEDINEQGLPPGFRFHPTDEELITFYLASKVFNYTFSGLLIPEVDLNRCEPWDLPDEAKMGEREWYFFSSRDRKYPTGLRTNRATGAGYWKATGKDREVYSSYSGDLLGLKKTLVFYKGRAPRGHKTRWVMHEYRLHGHFSYPHTCKEEWVMCRIFHKLGEKKTAIYEGGQSYLLEAFPTLLETSSMESKPNNPLTMQATHNNPFLNPVQHFPTNQYQQNQRPTTFPKHCKTETEAHFSQFQPFDANLRWMDEIHHSNPNLFGSDFSSSNLIGFFPSSSSSSSVREMSTSMVFNRAGFQMLVDPPSIRVSGESWVSDF